MGRLAYILGTSHSGSTLLAMLLGSHPDACTVGELKATSLGDPDTYRCSCGAPIKQCEFWEAVSRAMSRRGIDGFEITQAGTSIYDVQSRYAQKLLAPLQRGSGTELLRTLGLSLSAAWRRHLPETQRRNLALIESLQEVTGAKLVIDSSKVALRLRYLLQIPTLQIKVIRLVRDGRGVALTYMDEWSFADASDPSLRGGGSGIRRERRTKDMSDAAREWRRSYEAAECLVSTLPASQWMNVSYEELCADPEKTLHRVCAFLELDPAKVNLDFRARQQHVIGNGMRFDSTSEVRVDERWRKHLSTDDLSIFERIAGERNRSYGYG